MRTDLDLEELKRLLAEATQGEWRVEDYTVTIWGMCNPDDPTSFGMGIPIADTAKGLDVGRRYGHKVAWPEAETNARLIVAAVNALPDLIARVERAERAEKVLKAATEYAEANIEYWGAKANEVDYGTEGRSYCKGRVMTALALSNILTGDTPNV